MSTFSERMVGAAQLEVRIYKEVELDTQATGQAMTVVVLWENALHVGHVGDTRLYRLRREMLDQLTTDHTAVEESGEILHNRHVVTRVIGYPFPEPPEYNTTSLQEGDKILLCSDGLWSMMDGRTIYKSIIEAESPEKASEHLIAIANGAGGDDNITALTIFC